MRSSKDDRSTGRARGAHEAAPARRDTTGEARDRFGGVDLPAAFAGTMAALGALAVLGAVAGAWLDLGGYQDEVGQNTTLTVGGFLIALAVLATSALFGGWVTGRVARYAGTGNGLMTGLLLVLVVTGLGWLATTYAGEAGVITLPTWLTDPNVTTRAGVTVAVAAAVTVVAAALGGSLGSLYHRRVDRALTKDRPVVEHHDSDETSREQSNTIDLTDATPEDYTHQGTHDEGVSSKGRTRAKT